MKRIVYFAAVLSLTACQTLQTETQKIEAACAGASVALKALTVANNAGKLSLSQQAEISKAAHAIAPICTAPNPPTLDALKREAFLQAIAALESKAAGLEGN